MNPSRHKFHIDLSLFASMSSPTDSASTGLNALVEAAATSASSSNSVSSLSGDSPNHGAKDDDEDDGVIRVDLIPKADRLRHITVVILSATLKDVAFVDEDVLPKHEFLRIIPHLSSASLLTFHFCAAIRKDTSLSSMLSSSLESCWE